MTMKRTPPYKQGQKTPQLRHNPYLFPDTTSEDRWEERANCKGKAFELFEYQDKDSPLTEGMKFKDRIDFNRTNFQLAEEICIECPVFFECEANASPTERYWTVRGGNPPGRFDEESKRYDNVGRPPGAKNKQARAVASPTDRVCQRGHVVKGGGRCKDCKRANNTARQRRVRREAREKAGIQGQDAVT
jgi:hypothetical protein